MVHHCYFVFQDSMHSPLILTSLPWTITALDFESARLKLPDTLSTLRAWNCKILSDWDSWVTCNAMLLKGNCPWRPQLMLQLGILQPLRLLISLLLLQYLLSPLIILLIPVNTGIRPVSQVRQQVLPWTPLITIITKCLWVMDTWCLLRLLSLSRVHHLLLYPLHVRLHHLRPTTCTLRLLMHLCHRHPRDISTFLQDMVKSWHQDKSTARVDPWSSSGLGVENSSTDDHFHETISYVKRVTPHTTLISRETLSIWYLVSLSKSDPVIHYLANYFRNVKQRRHSSMKCSKYLFSLKVNLYWFLCNLLFLISNIQTK